MFSGRKNGNARKMPSRQLAPPHGTIENAYAVKARVGILKLRTPIRAWAKVQALNSVVVFFVDMQREYEA